MGACGLSGFSFDKVIVSRGRTLGKWRALFWFFVCYGFGNMVYKLFWCCGCFTRDDAQENVEGFNVA